MKIGKETMIKREYEVYAEELDGAKDVMVESFDTLKDAEGFCRYMYTIHLYIVLRQVTVTRIEPDLDKE